MVERIKKYSLYIIGALFILLCLQTCHSCDSIVILNHIIDKQDDEIKHLNAFIDTYKKQNKSLNENLKISLYKDEKSE